MFQEKCQKAKSFESEKGYFAEHIYVDVSSESEYSTTETDTDLTFTGSEDDTYATPSTALEAAISALDVAAITALKVPAITTLDIAAIAALDVAPDVIDDECGC